MLLTEEDARMRWCPFAVSANPIPVGPLYQVTGHNRDHPSGNIPACIASSCMAWRWNSEKAFREIDLVTSDVIKEEEVKPRLGFCGLARKPEFE